VDQRQLAELRRWATRLQETGSSEETRAAAKAILMLTEEVSQLTLQLEAARSVPEEVEQDLGPDEEKPEHRRGAWFRRTFGFGSSEEDGYSESEPG
jgi:hypothetical protein